MDVAATTPTKAPFLDWYKRSIAPDLTLTRLMKALSNLAPSRPERSS